MPEKRIAAKAAQAQAQAAQANRRESETESTPKEALEALKAINTTLGEVLGYE